MRLSQARAKFLAEENAQWTTELSSMPADRWPPRREGSYPTAVLRSRTFLVQIFDEASGLRMSVNRTEVARWTDGMPIWREGISWEELQSLKAQAGYGHLWAVECYPPDHKIVNVANMRHLWLLPAAPAFGWHLPC